MTPKEREVQRAKWRIQSKRKRDKKKKGTKPRSRKSLNKEQIIELQNRRQQGVSIQELMQDFHLSRSSTYRYLQERI